MVSPVYFLHFRMKHILRGAVRLGLTACVVAFASTPEELYLVDEVRDLCAHRGAALHLLVGPRAWDTWVSTSYAGARLTDFAPWVRDADVFVCGPNPWMDAVLADAEACGIPRSQVHDERFTW